MTSDTNAPAVHTDELPGGPRWMDLGRPDPEWIERKSQLERIMRERGLRPAEGTGQPAPADESSPYATPTRLKVGRTAPISPRPEHARPLASAERQVAEDRRRERIDMAQRGSGVIYGPNGEPISVASVAFTADEARLIRAYRRKILAKYGLRAALYCSSCSDTRGAAESGTNTSVTDSRIIVQCRCCVRHFLGPTY